MVSVSYADKIIADLRGKSNHGRKDHCLNLREVLMTNIDIESILREGRAVSFTPIGYSMLPLFRNKNDVATVAPCDRYKRGDVALYRRPGDKLILHRIVKVRGNEFWFTGDWQWKVEGPLSGDHVFGRMVAFERAGKKHDVSEPLYRFLFGTWLFLRPIRPVFMGIAAFIRFLPEKIKGNRR